MERVQVHEDRLGAQFFKSYRYDEIGYNLEIEFADGRKIVHSGVPRDVYEALHTSPHPGRFWAVAIRHNNKGEHGYDARMVG
jgi:hypothetical protein